LRVGVFEQRGKRCVGVGKCTGMNNVGVRLRTKMILDDANRWRVVGRVGVEHGICDNAMFKVTGCHLVSLSEIAVKGAELFAPGHTVPIRL
jgi:hypothetical protein